jgi:hypothetical protein
LPVLAADRHVEHHVTVEQDLAVLEFPVDFVRKDRRTAVRLESPVMAVEVPRGPRRCAVVQAFDPRDSLRRLPVLASSFRLSFP